MKVKDSMAWWKKTNLANVTSAFILIAVTLYFIYTKNNEGVMTLLGFAGGYLYGRRREQQ